MRTSFPFAPLPLSVLSSERIHAPDSYRTKPVSLFLIKVNALGSYRIPCRTSSASCRSRIVRDDMMSEGLKDVSLCVRRFARTMRDVVMVTKCVNVT